MTMLAPWIVYLGQSTAHDGIGKQVEVIGLVDRLLP
jgi:hypothetical protein